MCSFHYTVVCSQGFTLRDHDCSDELSLSEFNMLTDSHALLLIVKTKKIQYDVV